MAIGGGSVDGVGTPDTGVVRNAAATRLYKNVRHDIILSMAAIDLKAAHGKTVQQLADIATLHLFLDVSWRASAEAPSGSMLSLFSKRPKGMPAPTRLSQIDWGMLKGLYGLVDNNISAAQQRGRMVRETRRPDERGD